MAHWSNYSDRLNDCVAYREQNDHCRPLNRGTQHRFWPPSRSERGVLFIFSCPVLLLLQGAVHSSYTKDLPCLSRYLIQHTKRLGFNKKRTRSWIILLFPYRVFRNIVFYFLCPLWLFHWYAADTLAITFPCSFSCPRVYPLIITIPFFLPLYFLEMIEIVKGRINEIVN